MYPAQQARNGRVGRGRRRVGQRKVVADRGQFGEIREALPIDPEIGRRNHPTREFVEEEDVDRLRRLDGRRRLRFAAQPAVRDAIRGEENRRSNHQDQAQDRDGEAKSIEAAV